MVFQRQKRRDCVKEWIGTMNSHMSTIHGEEMENILELYLEDWWEHGIEKMPLVPKDILGQVNQYKLNYVDRI